MLPRAHRVHRAADFASAVRRGRRAGTSSVVVHALLSPPGAASPQLARVGFVVGRAVGGAVVRNQTRRRLRHLMAARLQHLPEGSTLVVRALPPAAGRSSVELGFELDRALDRALGGAPGRASRRGRREEV